MREDKSRIYFVLKTAFLVIGALLIFGKKYFLPYFSKSVISTVTMIMLAAIFSIGGVENYKKGDSSNSKRYFLIAIAILVLSIVNIIF